MECVIRCGEAVCVLAFRALNCDTWDESGVKLGVDNVGTRLQIVAGSHTFVIILFL